MLYRRLFGSPPVQNPDEGLADGALRQIARQVIDLGIEVLEPFSFGEPRCFHIPCRLQPFDLAGVFRGEVFREFCRHQAVFNYLKRGSLDERPSDRPIDAVTPGPIWT